MDLSNKQRRIVKLLAHNEGKRLSVGNIVVLLNLDENFRDGVVKNGQIRSCLTRLERRGIVNRRGYPARWQLTPPALLSVKNRGL